MKHNSDKKTSYCIQYADCRQTDVGRRAVIKGRQDLDLVADNYSKGNGWILPGQYFPESNLKLAGKEIVVEKQWNKVWAGKIDDEWHFFSEAALSFLE